MHAQKRPAKLTKAQSQYVTVGLSKSFNLKSRIHLDFKVNDVNVQQL